MSRIHRALLAFALSLLFAQGCRTSEEKLLDESLVLYATALEALTANAAAPDAGVKALQDLEVTSRDERARIRKAMETALSELSDDAKKAFQAEAKKRVEPLSAQIAEAIKRYPEDRRAYVRQLVGLLVR
jgi:hypothetical protein